MRGLLALFLLAALGAGGYIFYVMNYPPNFFIRRSSTKDKIGDFSFGGRDFPFALNSPESQAAGRPLGINTNWLLKVYTKENKVFFDLYKANSFIKTLHVEAFG